MTGYGRSSRPLGPHVLTVQVRSVNRRAFDLSVSLPEAWTALEPAVTERVRGSAQRGKIHVDVEWTSPGSEGPAWDERAVGAALDRLAALAAARGVPFQPTVELLWQVAQAQRGPAASLGAAEAEPAVLACLDQALADFTAMREREGAALLADFTARLDILRRLSGAAAERAPAVAPACRDALLKRLRDSGLGLDPTDERVLKEIALFADRCDVTEELTRFRSHLDQLASLLASDGEAGRKGEFILQELGREAHTLGAKANDLVLSRIVIELKNELEKVREQMANVE